MRALKAFVLGSLAIASSGMPSPLRSRWRRRRAAPPCDVGVGPLPVVSVTVDGATRVTTFGPGILVIALAGGLANVAAAELIRRRAGRQSDRVD